MSMLSFWSTIIRPNVTGPLTFTISRIMLRPPPSPDNALELSRVYLARWAGFIFRGFRAYNKVVSTWRKQGQNTASCPYIKRPSFFDKTWSMVNGAYLSVISLATTRKVNRIMQRYDSVSGTSWTGRPQGTTSRATPQWASGCKTGFSKFHEFSRFQPAGTLQELPPVWYPNIRALLAQATVSYEGLWLLCGRLIQHKATVSECV